MTEQSGDDRALEQVTGEMRDAPSGDLDWDRLERQLMARVDADARETRRSGGGRLAVILAAAAAVLLVVGVGLLRGDRAPQAGVPPVATTASRVFGPGQTQVDGNQLAGGDRVVAEAQAVVVSHPTRANYTLEPSSQATVEAVGDVIRLRLTQGAISAEVVPSPKPETFVIEVDEARVAVHGTAFRVVRTERGVNVSVSEGVVAVGGVGQKPSFFLRARDSGAFAKNGLTGEVQRGAEAAVEPPTVDPKPAGSAAAKAPAPATPSESGVAKALEQISASVSRCFTQSGAPGEVRVQMRTQLDVAFGADGKPHAMTFEPPLSPSVLACVQSDTAKLRFPESARGGSAQRSILVASE